MGTMATAEEHDDLQSDKDPAAGERARPGKAALLEALRWTTGLELHRTGRTQEGAG